MAETTQIFPFPSRAKPRVVSCNPQMAEFAILAGIIADFPRAERLAKVRAFGPVLIKSEISNFGLDH